MRDEEVEYVPFPPTFPIQDQQRFARDMGYTETELELKTKLLEINTEDLISKEMAISNLQHYEMPFLLAITTNTMISEDCEKMYRNWGFKETKLLFLKKLKAYLTMTRSRGGFERRMLATDIKRVISEQSFIQKSKSNLFGR